MDKWKRLTITHPGDAFFWSLSESSTATWRGEESSRAESRPMRHPYIELLLTGATRSMMPMYRYSNSFGRIELPDESWNYPEAFTAI